MSETRNIGIIKFFSLFFTRIIENIPPHNLISPFRLNRPVAISVEGVSYAVEISTATTKFALDILK